MRRRPPSITTSRYGGEQSRLRGRGAAAEGARPPTPASARGTANGGVGRTLAGVGSALAAEAQKHIEAADAAARASNWALYGEELNKLRDVIERMQTTP